MCNNRVKGSQTVFAAGHGGVQRRHGSHGASACSHCGHLSTAHARDHSGGDQTQSDGKGGEGRHSSQVPG